MKALVERYRRHPALLMWALGNEIQLGADTPEAWQFVEELARIVRGADTDHPIATVTAHMSNRVANALVEMGIGHGDKVALSCPNLPFFPIVYYGIMKAGAAVVPLNVLFKPREIAYHLKDSDAKAVFVFEGTDELPLAKCVKEAFDEVDTCEHLIVMTKNV